MAKNSSRKWIAALALAGGFYWYLRKPSSNPSVEAPAAKAPNVVAPPVAGGIEKAPPPGEDVQVERARVAAARQSYDLHVLTGLKELFVKPTAGTLFLPVAPRVEPQWCRLGDFDMMKTLSRDAGTKEFVLSVEPLYKTDKKPKSRRLSLSDIVRGQPVNFALPIQEQSRDYGVYFCLDLSKTQECGTKTMLPTKDWNNLVEASKRKDAILYFQIITVRDEKAYLIPSSQWDQDSMAKLSKNLASLMEDSERSSNLLRRMMQGLGSIGGKPEAQALILPFPYRDPRCGQAR